MKFSTQITKVNEQLICRARTARRFFSTLITGLCLLPTLVADAQLPNVGLVSNIRPGSAASSPNNLTRLGSIILFSANDGSNGTELWKSDGTKTGTVLVKDINPGTGNSSPANLVVMGSYVYFTANDGTNGGALWRSDGTAGGTTLVKDVNSTSTTSASFISELTAIGSKLYFRGDNGTSGTEPWTSDGTPGGTSMLKDIRSGSGSSATSSCFDCFGTYEFVEFNGYVYFNANDGNNSFGQNSELWRTDGTAGGTVLFKDNYTAGGGGAGNLVNAGSFLFFTSDNQSTTGLEPWKSDGTAGGTVMIKDIFNFANVGSITGDVPTAYMNGYVYFVAVDTYDASPPSGSSFYFNAELWRTDGTAANTTKVKEINPSVVNPNADANPNNFFVYNNKLYFSATDGTNGTEPWVTDGTAANTFMLKNINPGGNSNPSDFTQLGGYIYFRANDGSNGTELWRTDGTVANTVLVKDINPGAPSGSPNSLEALDANHMLFGGTNSITGSELHILGGYKIAVTTGANGQTDPPGAGSASTSIDVGVKSGTNLTFDFTPDPTYSVQSLTIDGSGAGTPASYAFTGVTANHTLNVTFATGPVCPTITVSNPAVTTGTAGTAFSQSFTASGGATPYTYTTASSLPAGMNLSAGGVLSGTPGQSGSFPIVVTATDANTCQGTGPTYTLVISCQAITVSSPGISTGTAGSAFSQTFTQTGAIGGATFTVNSGSLPTGLSLSAAGVLSGTPTQTGSFPLTIKVTDGNGCTGISASYTLVISCQTITVSNPGVSTGIAGTAFSQTFTQTGAISGTTFTVNSGSLPTGLSLSAAGVLSGTPTQTGSFPVTIKVTDGNGCTGIGTSYTLVISCQAITVSNPGITTGTAGTAFSQTFTQTGAIGTTTFTINSGSLPTGLSLSAAGVLSGTPTLSGSFAVTVKVTDGNGCTGTGSTYNLVIDCPVASIFFDGFESGSYTPNWAIGSGLTSGAVTSTNPYSGVYRLEGYGGTSSHLTGFSTSITTAAPSSISWDIYPTGNVATNYFIAGDNSVNATNCVVFSYWQGSANTIRFVNSGSIDYPATAGQWYHIELRNINWTAHTFDVWINNALVSTGFAFRSSTQNDISKIHLYNFGNGTGVWDNIQLGGASGTATPISQTVCTGNAVTPIVLSGAPAGATYNWTRDNTVAVTGIAASGSGDISGTLTNTGTAAQTVTFTITPVYYGTCTGTPYTATVLVNPVNTINLTSAPASTTQAVLINTPITDITYATTGATGASVTGLPAGVTGNWSGGVVTISGTPTTAVGSPFNYTVTLTGGCGTVTATGTITVITCAINLSSAAGTDAQTVCHNSPITNITYATMGATGASFTGLPAGITGNWAANVATISGTPTTAVGSPFNYTVTLTGNGCGSFSASGTIEVNPIPDVNQPADLAACNNSLTMPVNFTGAVAGTVYSWTNNTTSIGLAASGTGNIGSFTANNTGNAPVTATITVTPSYTNGGTTCTGTARTFSITVNPTATVTMVPDQVVCNNASTTAVNFSSPTSGGSIVYNWTNNTTGIGLAASGTGDIAGFTASNTGNAPLTATITVTASYTNGGTTCNGTPMAFTITVNPTATITTVPDQVVCNNFPTAAVNFSSPATGGSIIYNWTNNLISIGLPASGTGNIAGFTAINTGTTPVIATITVTPTYTNGGTSCTGTASSFTYTVNPTPAATIAYTASPYCSNAGTITATRTGTTGGIFTATPAGLSLNPATGDVTAGSSTAGSYTVTYTIAAAGGCASFATSAGIIITQLPAATINYAGSPYCSNVLSAPVTRSGTAGGTYSAAPAGLSIDAATGMITPNTSTPGSYTVSYTIAAGSGCGAVTAITTVIITAAPNMTILYAGTPYCSNAGTAAVSQFGTPGGTYSASPAGLTLNTTTGAVNLGTSTPGTYTVTYTIPASGGCGITTTQTTITVTAAPSGTIAYTGSPYCSNAGTATITQTGTAGGTYSSTAGLSLNATTGAVNLATSIPGTYTVTYTIGAAGGCAAFTATGSITITALPAATISYTGSPYCQNAGIAMVTRTGNAGGSYTATPAGLAIDGTTGEVALSTSIAGSYTVSYTLAAGNGCPAVVATTTITITSLPVATISYTGSPYCQNTGIATVTQTGTTGGTYTASPAGLSVNGVTGDITPGTSTPGTYTVTYTIGAGGGCGAVTATTTVTVSSLSTAPTGASTSASTVCGPTTVTLTVAGGSLGSGANWKWYSGSCSGSPAGTGASITVQVNATTTYYVRAEGSCNTTSCASVTVTVNEQPTISISAAPVTVIKPFVTTTLTAAVTPVTGTSINWYKNGVEVAGATGTSLVVTIDDPGQYSARAITTAGCTALSNVVTITTAGTDQLYVTANPNHGQFKVRFYTGLTQFNFNRHLVMYAENGQKVYDRIFRVTGPYSSMDVDARHLASGFYTIMVTDAFGKEVLSTGKVVIQQ